MKIAAIIAEYNPFHNGHAYQLQQTKSITGADYVIAVMSGHFVQRGEPAIYNKWERAEMALKGGIDCVIELPGLYATASAETFALGAMLVIKTLNCIDTVSFGSETGDIQPLEKIATLLTTEPTSYQEALREALKSGHSYPKARQLGIDAIDPTLSPLLSGSNNILGIEYLRAINTLNLQCEPVTIKRIGQKYLDEQHPTNRYASATAIRRLILDARSSKTQRDDTLLASYLPNAVFHHLCDRHHNGLTPITPSDLFDYYHYLLIHYETALSDVYYDCPKELMNRLKRLHRDYDSYSTFIDAAQTRNYTKTTIQRALLHLYLHITQAEIDHMRNLNQLPFSQVLGFRKEASPLLKALKKQALSPLVTNVADAKKKLSYDDFRLLQQSIRMTQLYPDGSKKDDYTHPIIIL